MQTVLYLSVSKSDLAQLFGHSVETIQRWTNQGLPQNKDSTYMIIKAIRWREKQFKEQLRQKIEYSQISQRDLIILTGLSRQTIYNLTKAGLPRNADRRYDLSKVVRWLLYYFKGVYQKKIL